MQQFFLDLIIWFRDELKAFFLWAYDALLSGLSALFNAIPLPDFLVVNTMEMPSGIAYFAEAFQIDIGLGIVVSAYVARFILRRIPIIG